MFRASGVVWFGLAGFVAFIGGSDFITSFNFDAI